MRIEGVVTRVISGKMLDEVFITCDDPYINVCVHLPGKYAGKIKSGDSIEFATDAPAPSPMSVASTTRPEAEKPKEIKDFK